MLIFYNPLIFAITININIVEINFYKSTGILLITGSLLASITMVLHPTGGNMQHISNIATSLQITHALAIFCLPCILFGFYGITHKLSDVWRVSTLAFIITAFGLFAVMLSAVFNGLVLPSFLIEYSENIAQHNTILHYGFTINKAFDYVFIISLCLAITIYSIIIITSKKLSKWIGYLGIIIMILAIVGATINFVFASLTGFRIVIFSIVAWTVYSGVALITSKKQSS